MYAIWREQAMDARRIPDRLSSSFLVAISGEGRPTTEIAAIYIVSSPRQIVYRYAVAGLHHHWPYAFAKHGQGRRSRPWSSALEFHSPAASLSRQAAKRVHTNSLDSSALLVNVPVSIYGSFHFSLSSLILFFLPVLVPHLHEETNRGGGGGEGGRLICTHYAFGFDQEHLCVATACPA